MAEESLEVNPEEAIKEQKNVPDWEKPSLTLKIPKNGASALAYATGCLPYIGWLTGLLMLIIEKDKDVRFHSIQAVGTFGLLALLQIVFGGSVLFDRVYSLLVIIQFVVWLVLVYKTYTGQKWILPYIGEWAEKQIKQGK